jgi:hypothetical protein
MYNTRPEARTANSTCKKVAVQYSADIFVLKLPAIVNLQTVIDSLKTDTTAQGFVFNFFCRPSFFKHNFRQYYKWHFRFCQHT